MLTSYLRLLKWILEESDTRLSPSCAALPPSSHHPALTLLVLVPGFCTGCSLRWTLPPTGNFWLKPTQPSGLCSHATSSEGLPFSPTYSSPWAQSLIPPKLRDFLYYSLADPSHSPMTGYGPLLWVETLSRKPLLKCKITFINHRLSYLQLG